MLALRYSADSKEDLKQIARYISKDKPLAARKWVAKIRAKCQLIAQYPEVGDDRSELGPSIRSSYVGPYAIFFRKDVDYLEIVRIIRGDRDTQSVKINPQSENG